jgi:alkaline phosphatase D
MPTLPPATARSAFTPDRRTMLGLGLFGVGALGMASVPGAAQALTAQGFTHGVASGEPSATGALLWTRYVASGETRLGVELSATADFASIQPGGEAIASGERDHTAKLMLSGLAPDRWYFYRFVAPDGTHSPVGRTRTLPEGRCDRFTLAVFSCANMGFGYFHAYADAAERGDIDLAVHLGDYLYEYADGTYPEANERVAERTIAPLNEAIALADYRLRHAAYRADPALQRLHQALPMIMQWDDHELANDAWMGGAENHTPATEGSWATRKVAAIRAYREWLPVSDDAMRSYDIGSLATIVMPETRITGRMQQLDLAAALIGPGGLTASLERFRDGPWRDPARSMLGAPQFAALTSRIAQSVRGGTRWQILAQQVVMGTLNAPPATAAWAQDNAPDFVRRRFAVAAAAGRAGLPLNFDSWDGYPAERTRLLAAIQSSGANLISLAGDSHNAWAFDLTHDNRPVGVDLGVQSVTSPGFEAYTNVGEVGRTRALIASSPGLRWANTQARGYMTLTLTPAAATATYRLIGDVRSRTPAMLMGQAIHRVRHGTNRIEGD